MALPEKPRFTRSRFATAAANAGQVVLGESALEPWLIELAVVNPDGSAREALRPRSRSICCAAHQLDSFVMRQPDFERLLLRRQAVEANRRHLALIDLRRSRRRVGAHQIASVHRRPLNPPTVDQQIHGAVGARRHAQQHNPCPQQSISITVAAVLTATRTPEGCASALNSCGSSHWDGRHAAGGAEAGRGPCFELCEPTEQLDGHGMRASRKSSSRLCRHATWPLLSWQSTTWASTGASTATVTAGCDAMGASSNTGASTSDRHGRMRSLLGRQAQPGCSTASVVLLRLGSAHCGGISVG